MHLRDFRVSPCIACDACARYAGQLGAASARGGAAGRLPCSAAGAGKEPSGDAPGDAFGDAAALALFAQGRVGGGRAFAFGCPLTAGDDSAALLGTLLFARSLCLIAPVYFYHVPAQLKALLDRTQALWNFAAAGFRPFAGQPPKPCKVVFVAARKRGERLFEGSLLTMRYALKSLHYRLAEPLLLNGMEAPGDLAGDESACVRVRDYAGAAPCPDLCEKSR